MLGLLIVSRFDNPRFDTKESIALMLVIGVLAMTVFYSGQIVDTYTSDGADLAWRVASRYLLSIVFILFMAIGTAFGVHRGRKGT